MIQPISLICRPNIGAVVFAQRTSNLTTRFVYSTLTRQRAITATTGRYKQSYPSVLTSESLIRSNKAEQALYSLQRQAAFVLQDFSSIGCVRTMTIPAGSTHPFHCVHVYIKVVPGMEDAFMEATLQNARASSHEEGVLRFDVYRDQENSNEFVLVEVYKDSTIAPAHHKETSHYLLWRDTVAPMMAEERTRRLFNNLFPITTEGWKYPSNEPLE